jgi:hypothetical protein
MMPTSFEENNNNLKPSSYVGSLKQYSTESTTATTTKTATTTTTGTTITKKIIRIHAAKASRKTDSTVNYYSSHF